MQFRTKLLHTAALLTHSVGHLANAIYMNEKNNNNENHKKNLKVRKILKWNVAKGNSSDEDNSRQSS